MPGRSGESKRRQLAGNDNYADEDDDFENERRSGGALTHEERTRNIKENIYDDLDDTLAVALEGQEVADRTNQKLAGQNEQIRKAYQDGQDINENVQKGKHHLTRMEMCCCFAILCCCCHPQPEDPRERTDIGVARTGGVVSQQPESKQMGLDPNEEGITEQERHDRRVNNGLDQLSNVLDNLGRAAELQGQHVKETSELVKKLDTQVEDNIQEIRGANARGKALLR